MSHQQNIEQSHNIKVVNKSLKMLMGTKQLTEITFMKKSRLNVQELSSLIYLNMYKLKCCLVFCMDVKLGLSQKEKNMTEIV
jgi:hypothetical protein